MNLVRRLRVGPLGSWAATFRPYSGKDKDKDKSKTPPKSPPKPDPKKAPTKAKAPGGTTSKAKAKTKVLEKNKDLGDAEADGFPKDITPVTLIIGEGVGPELMKAVQDVLACAKAPVKWESFEEAKAPDSDDVAPAIVESLRKTRVGFKGPVDSRHWQRHIRKQFIQFAYVSACRNIEGLDSPYGEFDMVIVRDQMEGDYSGIEHRVVPGVMQTIKVCTTAGAERLARFVFLYAMKNNRRKITVAHKANIMRMTDGNFLEAMRRLADSFVKKIKFEERYLDTAIMNMLMKPERGDVLVSSSMYGDVMRVIAGNMMGAPDICPGFSVSSLGTVFDCRMKSHPELAGKDLANPTGPLLAAALMLRHIKQEKYANLVECAVRGVYKDTDIRTQDVGGCARCSEFVKAVCERLEKD